MELPPHRRRHRLTNYGLWLSTAALLLASCSDETLSTVVPRIDVDPESLDFGDSIVGQDTLQTLEVKNLGAAPLEIISTRFEPDEGVYFVRGGPDQVRPTGVEPMQVAFHPLEPKRVYPAMLLIESNDPERPIVEVPVTGIGGQREIELFPESIDFGVVDEGTVARQAVEIRNIGGDVLEINEIVWTSTSVDLVLAPGFRGGSLAARTATVVELVYSPADLGGDIGTLTIRSNDEDEPELDVPVTGRANLAPRAIAWACDTTFQQVGCENVDRGRRFTLGVGQRVGLDGRESTDPEGTNIVSYRWEIVEAPENSTSAVFHSTDDITMRRRATGDFESLQVGRYDLRLIVKDARGLESLDRPESHILIAPKDLEIALRWDIDTDVDLHLVRPGGQVGDYGSGGAGTSTGSDCSTFNRAPNWNDLMTDHDDPRLDIDVVRSRGPEITSLNRPQTDGAYTVYAHYCDSQQVRVPVNVTIEVYVQGTLVASVPEPGRTFSLAPGEVWGGAQVRWLDTPVPSVEVTPMLDVLPEMRPELCLLNP